MKKTIDNYHAPLVLVDGEYIPLPDGATYDTEEQAIMRRPTVVRELTHLAIGMKQYWGPAASRRNHERDMDIPEGLTYSA